MLRDTQYLNPFLKAPYNVIIHFEEFGQAYLDLVDIF